MGIQPDGGFERLYLAERPRVLAAPTLVAAHDLAVEGTDEAFARAYERWRRVAGMANPTGWVYRVAVNHVRRLGRRRRLERRLLTRTAAPPASTTPTESTPQDGALWEAVRTLPERQRMAFVLRHVADLPETEVPE